MFPTRYTDCGLENEKLSYTAICSHWLTRLVGKVTSITRKTPAMIGKKTSLRQSDWPREPSYTG